MHLTKRNKHKIFYYLNAKRIERNRWNDISRNVVCLKKDSNIIGLCLTTQLVGSLAASFTIVLLLRFMQAALNSRFAHVMMQNTGSALYNLVNLVIYTVQMFIPFALLCFILRKSPLKDAGVKRIRNKRLLPRAFVITLGIYGFGEIVTGIISGLLNGVGLQPNTPDFSAPSGPAAFTLYCLMICVFAPLFEEFIFRGIILQTLRRYGDGFAVVASAAMFGLLHGNLGQVPYAFFAGLALAYFTIRLGSIWFGVMAHCLINSASVVVEKLSGIYGQTIVTELYAAVLAVFIILSAVILLYHAFNRYKTGAETKTPPGLPGGLAAKVLVLAPGFLFFLVVYVLMNIVNLKR